MAGGDITNSSDSPQRDRRVVLTQRVVGLIIVGFVVWGIALRLLRYGLCFPLYGDEGSLAANFLDRDFSSVFRPLDYGQIAPLGFLWGELLAVKLVGFSEYSLRLLPFLASVTSLGVFAFFARRFCGQNLAAALAVAVFAVSAILIRYSAEIKPYSFDLLVAILILYVGVKVIEGEKDSRLLWLLALFVPVAALVSLPSLFVLAGLLLTLGIVIISKRELNLLAPTTALALSTLFSFGIYYVYFLSPHHEFHKENMTSFWAVAFPPLDNPLHFIAWFVDIHTGRLMAYPAGDKHGSSALSFIFFVVGAVTVWKSGRRASTFLLLSPFLMTFAAAALHRYPYGGSARIVQHLAPSACLLIGIGIDRSLRACARPLRNGAEWKLTFASLALLGLGLGTADSFKPYIEKIDPVTRRFCRDLWKGHHDNTALVVLTSFDHDRSTGILHREATWRCYQHIYAPKSTFCAAPPDFALPKEQFGTVIVHLAANDLIDEERLVRAENWINTLAGEYDAAHDEGLVLNKENQLHLERVHVMTLHHVSKESSPASSENKSLSRTAGGATRTAINPAKRPVEVLSDRSPGGGRAN